MFLTVALPISRTVGTVRRSVFIRTTSAAPMAMSVPEPTAMPTLAWVRAGASFIPSPTMATVFCFIWSSLTMSILSFGIAP